MPLPGLGVIERVMGWKRRRPDEAETDASGSRGRRERAAATAGGGDGGGDKPTSEDVPPEFLCPITHDVMRDPVSTADGHTYEREAIARWLENRRTSPKTNEPLESVVLVANLSIRSLISTWMERNGRRFAPRPGELREAASKGDVEELRALLRAGADCDDKRENGWAALRWASQDGHRDVVELLVGAGADVNRAEKSGWTALMKAS